MKLFNGKDDEMFLTKEKWRKLFLATSLMIIVLYIVAMICSTNGSNMFILRYENAHLDKVEKFMREQKLMGLVTALFLTLEFSIVLSFIINKRTEIYYPAIFYFTLIIPAFLFDLPDFYYSIIQFPFYLGIPLIEQYVENKYESVPTKKFSFKKYLICLLKLVFAIGATYLLQVIIYAIKTGNFAFSNNIMTLSGYVIYSIEYDIALFIILFTIRLYINKEKGDKQSWTKSQDLGGFSQTLKIKSQKSTTNLSKTQKKKIKFFYFRLYLTQIVGFTLLMVLPFLLGKVLEFLIMYLAFAIARYILGFKYSLHYKKEVTCIGVGVLVFGIVTLAVPFFYVNLILGISIGVALAIFLHFSYRYKGLFIFAKVCKPDKFATLYVYFDEDLSERHIKSICRYKGLSSEQTHIIWDYMQGHKISYLSTKYNYSQRMFIYKLDEAMHCLIHNA